MPPVVTYRKGRNHLTSDLEGDGNAESDCDGDPPGVNDKSQATNYGDDDETRAVLTIGSFSACVHFLLPRSFF